MGDLERFSDGKINATRLIQQKIDSISDAGGGMLTLPAGEFLVDSIKLGIKTSISGAGIGSTIIRQTASSKSPCLIISTRTAGIEISSLTLSGNDKNEGIYVEYCVGDGENHNYAYTKFNKWDKKQAYKWSNISDIAVYHFDVGILIEPWGFNINICNSTIGMNGDGVIMRNTDSSIYNCYVNNNRRNGLWIVGGNNKATNIKSIFNGRENGAKYAAVLLDGARCQLSNIETQDNFCQGYWIRGEQNIVSNCISNTDGYSKTNYYYSSETEGYGFHISQVNNIFSSCMVTSYSNQFGAIYKSPIKVDLNVATYYTDITKDIRIVLSPNRYFFNEPIETSLNMASKAVIEGGTMAEVGNRGRYLQTSNSEGAYLLRREDYDLDHLSTIIDFRISKFANNECLWSIGEGDDKLKLVLSEENGKKSISLVASGPRLKLSLPVDEVDSLLNHDVRVLTSFLSVGGQHYIRLQAYLKHGESHGWIRHQATTGIGTESLRKIPTVSSFVRFGDGKTALNVKRFVMGYMPVDADLIVPGASLTSLYTGSLAYFDADTYKEPYFRTSGPTSKRPALTRFDVGYQYFDTTLGAPVWWDGEKWTNGH